MICPFLTNEIRENPSTDLPLLVDQVVASQDEVDLRDLLSQPHVVVGLHVSEGDHILAS